MSNGPDDGTARVWTLRHIETFGKRRTFCSLLHGTMASAMPSAIGLQKCQPGRQVVCMAGDGGLAMLLGELLKLVWTTICYVNPTLFATVAAKIFRPVNNPG
jgi:thiamine pyrophosphate-dependent acetolactate synthase large subunit-like protein